MNQKNIKIHLDPEQISGDISKQLPKIVPVTENFDLSKLIGEAVIKMDGEVVIADIEFIEPLSEKLQKLLEPSNRQSIAFQVSGTASFTREKVINDFKLKGISIVSKM